jgi:hypothetical protein
MKDLTCLACLTLLVVWPGSYPLCSAVAEFEPAYGFTLNIQRIDASSEAGLATVQQYNLFRLMIMMMVVVMVMD